jgi:AcrR family transcriptional regulator
MPATEDTVAGGEPVRGRRVGRPAQIDRQAIAEAARQVGLERLTLKAVADRLGVSVAGLYHHIRGKDDLLRLAVERTSAATDVPLDHDQHWAGWLAEWAAYEHDAFVAEPVLVDQFLAGAINTEAIAGTTDAVLGLLLRQGFTIAEAHAAYQLTSSCALGAALKAIRKRRSRAGGRSEVAELHRVLDDHGRDELPHLRRFLAMLVTDAPATFAAELTMALTGVAVTRGEAADGIDRLVAEALAATGDGGTAP